MKLAPRENDEQRRRRVVGRIRNELRVHVADDLVEIARAGKLPDRWMHASDVNQFLDENGYWAKHRHVLARFLSRAACEDVVLKALDVLACTHAETWGRAGSQFKPYNRDWNDYAAAKANLLRREHPEAERTAFHTGSDGASVLFAHDDYRNDRRARDEVAHLRQFLADTGIPELGFGTSDDGRTWVMVVWSQDEQALQTALFRAWETAFGSAAA